MRFDNIPREAWIGLAVLFLLMTQNAAFIGLLFLVGILMLARSMSDNQNQAQADRPTRRRSRPEVRVNRPIMDNTDTVLIPEPEVDHVYEAITTAGHDPDQLKVLPVDLGLLVYKDNQQEIYRNQAIPHDVDYVRPFVELQLPASVSGKVRFELLDSNGNSLFVDENSHQLKSGRQPIVAATWLPIHDAQELDGMWQLKVSAGGVLLANHVFEWDTEVSAAPIREHIQEDGEISPELRQAMAENRLQKMSLDELLADQQEEEPARRNQKR
ncbi:MAG: hypothetical protein H7X77_06965 [Anaerolineae bacterium]|nr:hypothetical protein [Anaerolineae bacterium]